MTENNLCIGERVHVAGERGTIRYVGSVERYKGQWVGIEWDDPSRGKHNGIVEGKQYFTTCYETGGSLVKVENVSFGTNLLESILNRYGANIGNNEVIVMDKKKVELVGMESTSHKQNNIHMLRHIVLDNCFVAAPPPAGTPPFKYCYELNLYKNLLHRWEDIREILEYFPNLNELVLRKNRMDIATGNTLWNCATHLRDLIVSECGLSSESISQVLRWLPSVERLYALGNHLCFLNAYYAADRLTVLDLENNPIICLSNIIGCYPRLEKLSVVSCEIHTIRIEEDRFPRLKILNLKKNIISEWSSVNQLQKLKFLNALYMDCHYLTSESGIEVHEVVVAKLSPLIDLNRFDVSAAERVSAEIRFINKYAGASLESKRDHQHDLDRLIKVHGQPTLDTAKKGLKILKLQISYGDKSIEKSLPLGITIQKLLEMLARMFCKEFRSLRLELDKGGHRVPLDNNMRSIDFYSPEQGNILRLLDL